MAAPVDCPAPIVPSAVLIFPDMPIGHGFYARAAIPPVARTTAGIAPRAPALAFAPVPACLSEALVRGSQGPDAGTGVGVVGKGSVARLVTVRTAERVAASSRGEAPAVSGVAGALYLSRTAATAVARVSCSLGAGGSSVSDLATGVVVVGTLERG